MDIPYSLIHELEYDYGSLSLVPSDNPILKKIHNILRVENIEEIYYRNEDKVLYLHEKGFGRDEMTNIYGIPQSTVNNIFFKHHLREVPSFRYVLHKDGRSNIFCKKIIDVGLPINHAISNTAMARRLCSKYGYRLKKPRKIIRWHQLRDGDQYIDNCKIKVKGID